MSQVSAPSAIQPIWPDHTLPLPQSSGNPCQDHRRYGEPTSTPTIIRRTEISCHTKSKTWTAVLALPFRLVFISTGRLSARSVYLCRKAVAVPIQNLDERVRLVEKHEQMTGQWIIAKLVTDNTDKTVERLSHISTGEVYNEMQVSVGIYRQHGTRRGFVRDYCWWKPYYHLIFLNKTT